MRKAFLGERIREWFCAQEKLRAESFPDKKSQRTLVNFVDNRQFLCYNKPATWKKVFFFMPEIAEVRAAKTGQK